MAAIALYKQYNINIIQRCSTGPDQAGVAGNTKASGNFPKKRFNRYLSHERPRRIVVWLVVWYAVFIIHFCITRLILYRGAGVLLPLTTGSRHNNHDNNALLLVKHRVAENIKKFQIFGDHVGTPPAVN